MPRRLRIALIVETQGAYGRSLLDGIASYGQDAGPWTFLQQENTADRRAASWLRRWQPDGILARITSRPMGLELRQLGVPVVDLLEETAVDGVPGIVSDDDAVVRAAVDHLLDRGLTRLAYVGLRGATFSDRRRDAFRAYSRHRGIATEGCPELDLREKLPGRHATQLGDWLRALRTPVGIVACNDARAAQVLRACSECGISVPDEAAVIGVDDDPVICHLSDPALSSVDPNARKVGYLAARMLHETIESGRVHPPVTFVEPAGVLARRSTDVLAIPSARAVAAVRELREHACDGLTVTGLCRRVGTSRRTLERLFAIHVGRSPSAELSRIRLERVRELLVGTDLSLAEIARIAGFAHVESMCRLFKAATGAAPGSYRRDMRPKGRAMSSRQPAQRR